MISNVECDGVQTSARIVMTMKIIQYVKICDFEQWCEIGFRLQVCISNDFMLNRR